MVGQGHRLPGLQRPQDRLIGKEAAAGLQHDCPAGQRPSQRSQQHIVVCPTALAEPAAICHMSRLEHAQS